MFGIDQRLDRRALCPDLVVVGNDQAHAGRPAPGDVNRVAPAIAGDHKAGAARVQFVERLRVQAIAFSESIGDIGDDVGAHRPQATRKGDAGGHAVGVVVAVDRDPLSTIDGVRNQLARDRHVFQ